MPLENVLLIELLKLDQSKCHDSPARCNAVGAQSQCYAVRVLSASTMTAIILPRFISAHYK